MTDTEVLATPSFRDDDRNKSTEISKKATKIRSSID